MQAAFFLVENFCESAHLIHFVRVFLTHLDLVPWQAVYIPVKQHEIYVFFWVVVLLMPYVYYTRHVNYRSNKCDIAYK